jgi:hypothetical protein
MCVGEGGAINFLLKTIKFNMLANQKYGFISTTKAAGPTDLLSHAC